MHKKQTGSVFVAEIIPVKINENARSEITKKIEIGSAVDKAN